MVQRTKQALAASLKKLLRTKPISQIIINDITEDCGVNRMTFYYHFHDIYDLVEWILEEEISNSLKNENNHKNWKKSFENVLYILKENHSFIVNIYHYGNKDYIENYLNKMIFRLTFDEVEEKTIGLPIQEKDKIFIADFYKYALVGMILNWIKKDMKEDPSKIVSSLDFVTFWNISSSLQRFQPGSNSHSIKQ
jgi:probable dihydroxyacetone kinase regulator